MRHNWSASRGLQRVTCLALMSLFVLMGVAGCSSSSGDGEYIPPATAIVVNSLLDDASPPDGTVTLRSAIATASSGQTITFDQTLNGSTIDLLFVGEEHTTLVGEVMGFDDANNISFLVGYFDRSESSTSSGGIVG